MLFVSHLTRLFFILFSSPLLAIEWLLFASFSIPENSFQDYLKDMSQTQGRILLRGLHRQSLPLTAQKISAHLKGLSQGGIQIDPNLFEKFHITHTPTFVLWDQEKNRWDCLSGHVTVAQALETIQLHGDLSADAQNLLTTLRNKSR